MRVCPKCGAKYLRDEPFCNKDGSQTQKTTEILSDPGRAVGRISGFITGADPGEYMLAGLKATGIRLDALGIATVIVRDTPERVPYQNGRTLALIPISYIPRILWPGKPSIASSSYIRNVNSAESRVTSCCH